METLIALLVACLVLGLVYYIVTLIPLPPPFRTVALIIICIIAILWLVSVFGFGGLPVFHARRY